MPKDLPQGEDLVERRIEHRYLWVHRVNELAAASRVSGSHRALRGLRDVEELDRLWVDPE